MIFAVLEAKIRCSNCVLDCCACGHSSLVIVLSRCEDAGLGNGLALAKTVIGGGRGAPRTPRRIDGGQSLAKSESFHRVVQGHGAGFQSPRGGARRLVQGQRKRQP